MEQGPRGGGRRVTRSGPNRPGQGIRDKAKYKIISEEYSATSYHQNDEKPTHDKADHYGPPTKEYLLPMREDQKHYHPPNKDYLPLGLRSNNLPKTL